MKFSCSVALAVLLAYAGGALADGTRYTILADGLACPVCAYNIAKRLKGVDGVIEESIRVDDLGKGRVRLDVQPDVESVSAPR